MKDLLSIDWDYFIATRSGQCLSYSETKRTAVDLWYKRYLRLKAYGKNIQNLYYLSPDVKEFWTQIKAVFQIDERAKVYVSDSHMLSYNIAEHHRCQRVYLFDAHADLGYSVPKSLEFEVNCGNWLGRLLKEKIIQSAHIIYSPFTNEKPTNFAELNRIYAISYPTLEQLKQEKPISNVTAVHICRSGAWTPPWYDYDFKQFVEDLGRPYQVIKCPLRDWNPTQLTLADELELMLGS